MDSFVKKLLNKIEENKTLIFCGLEPQEVISVAKVKEIIAGLTCC